MQKERTINRRILMLLENSTYPRDGRVRREATTLVRAGYHVTIIAPALPAQPHREVIDGVHLYRYPPPPAAKGMASYLVEYGYAMAATALLSVLVLWHEGFDAIHAHSPPDTFVFIAALYKLFGKRFVYDHHDLSPEMYEAVFDGRAHRVVRRLLLAFEKLSCRLADHVIATNESYRAVEMERDHVPAEHITVVRNGPELEELPDVQPAPAVQPNGKIIIGYIGVIGFQDGVDHLLRAFRHLRDQRDDFVGVIVGDGEAVPSLQALAKDLRLDGSVRFAGWQEHADLARYMAAMEICAAPEPSNDYTNRSTMLKIMDYMAWGKPIVAFDLPEHRCSAGEAAVYAPPNDDRAFARALAQLMDDPDRRAVVGHLGRVRVREQLAWQYQAPRLLEVYEKLLG